MRGRSTRWRSPPASARHRQWAGGDDRSGGGGVGEEGEQEEEERRDEETRRRRRGRRRRRQGGWWRRGVGGGEIDGGGRRVPQILLPASPVARGDDDGRRHAGMGEASAAGEREAARSRPPQSPWSPPSPPRSPACHSSSTTLPSPRNQYSLVSLRQRRRSPLALALPVRERKRGRIGTAGPIFFGSS